MKVPLKKLYLFQSILVHGPSLQLLLDLRFRRKESGGFDLHVLIIEYQSPS